MKSLLFKKYNQLSILFCLFLITGVLLMFRIKISESFYLIFLIWNIFLAAIPYGTTFLIRLNKGSSLQPIIKVILFGIWLLFLPNAPYIISDFTHLRWTSSNFLLLDTIIIGGSALMGLLFMVYSIRDMEELFLSTLSRKHKILFRTTICILIGIGIYLGRYLRWNSWDIVQNPSHLITDVSAIIVHPIRNKFAWFITGTYATISLIAITTINKLKWAR